VTAAAIVRRPDSGGLFGADVRSATWRKLLAIMAGMLYIVRMVQAHISNMRAASRGDRHRSPFAARGASLGLSPATPAELIRKLERGFPFDSIVQLANHSGIPVSRIAAVVGIPERTLARRKTSGRLTLDESERLLRLANIFEKACDLFEGDVPAAVNWLTAEKKALGEQVPLDYSRTELGAREVENLIGQLEHGVFA
jgi:putative toxin-antitoxin system antitoxin component (TIGR02293 family)